MTENGAELILALMAGCSLLLYGLGFRRPTSQLPPPLVGRELEKCLLLLMVIVTMVVIPLMDLLVPWFEFADFVFLDEVAWIGLIVGTGALWLFWRALDDWLRLNPGPDCLMDRGIYRYLRHPLYAAMFLWSVGQLLLLQNWLAGPAAAITFLLFYVLRLPLDEQRGLERFGYRYLDYMNRTGAILPRLSLPRR